MGSDKGGVVIILLFLCRKHMFADDKADLQDLKERFLKGTDN